MENISTYLGKTESAVRTLFDGIARYRDILAPISGVTFVSSNHDDAKWREEYEAWHIQNEDKLRLAREAQSQYVSEAFACAVLAGAVLQVAAKAIEIFSQNRIVRQEWQPLVGNTKEAARACIGRLVLELPAGLVVYVGRNQHMHYNESALRRVGAQVFAHLKEREPSLDLDNPRIESAATNILGVLGWQTYEDYSSDMVSMLDS